MPLIPWHSDEFDRMFGDEWFLPVLRRDAKFEPLLDLSEDEKNLVAEVSLPDADPDKIEVSVEDQMLRIAGSTEEENEEKEKGYWRREIRRGSFERAVRLPVPVDEDKVRARYAKGVLTVTMPKADRARKKNTVKVQAA